MGVKKAKITPAGSDSHWVANCCGFGVYSGEVLLLISVRGWVLS